MKTMEKSVLMIVFRLSNPSCNNAINQMVVLVAQQQNFQRKKILSTASVFFIYVQTEVTTLKPFPQDGGLKVTDAP